MSLVPEKTQKLVSVLLEQTMRGDRSWEKGSTSFEFVFVHDAGSVIVASVDSDGAPPFSLRILDTAGSTVERYDEREDEGLAYLGQLYEAAARSSLKSSAVTETLLSQLQREDDIPF